MPDWNAIARDLSFDLAEAEPASGGCINQAATFRDPAGRRLFVKANAVAKLSMFEAEAEALVQIGATGAIRVPSPIACGTTDTDAYLALERIEFGRPKPGSWEMLGEGLASLHAHTDSNFGWHRDNVIGETHQPNTHEPTWATFFVEHRLRHQLELASRNGYRFEQSDVFLDRANELLAGHHPEPSLLHGDLWSGNAGFDPDGAPVVFDPASYYGDPETDIAFTEMFGGFDRAFYDAYMRSSPPTGGKAERHLLYNLYHLLNHANLFGGSYVDSCRSRIRELM